MPILYNSIDNNWHKRIQYRISWNCEIKTSSMKSYPMYCRHPLAKAPASLTRLINTMLKSLLINKNSLTWIVGGCAACQSEAGSENPFNALRPRQNGHRFADHTFKRISLNENVIFSITIPLKFVPKGPINNIPALVQIMDWRRIGDMSLSEPMLTRFTDAYMQHYGETS